MANFKIHLSVASVGSGLVSTALLGTGIASPKESVTFWAAGTLGGILPDIDSDHSTSVTSIFIALGLILGILVVFDLARTHSILELWLAFALTYTAIRYGILKIFYKFTVHRGIFHTIVAGLFFGFLSTALCFQLLSLNSLFSWYIGAFVFFGYLLHLFLDELYAINFVEKKIKRSFGTALGIVDYSNLKTSALITAATAAIFFATPNIREFVATVIDKQIFLDIFNNFLPW